MVSISQVIERRQIDGEDANRRDANSDGGHDPMDRAEACPAEHEETNWHTGAHHAGKVQAAFRRVCELAVSAGDLLLVDGDDGGEDAGGAHGGEDGVGLLEAEGMVGLEDERDSGEGQV